MQIRYYNVTLTAAVGSALLMHNDNIQWADAMEAWLKQPGNKAASKAGDDRTPGFKWIGSLYMQGGKIVIPSENLMTMLRDGGKKCPTGKGKGSFKTMTQTGIMPTETGWPVLIGGQSIATAAIEKLRDAQETEFAKHEALAKKLGFALHVKRAKVGTSKHIRVRPVFENWSATGTLQVTEKEISAEILQMILTQAGAYIGLGDWRPSSPQSPGTYGRFTADVQEMEAK